MALLPPRSTTIQRIYDGYEARARKDPPRLHLGASEIGRECERQIWYGFRWAKDNIFPGQILRLFDTGKLEENRLVADLSSIGVDVRAFDLKTGRQFRLETFGGHFGGSLDGICLGVVEAPKTWHVLEMKTHNERSFKSLVDKGVKESKPEHFYQMQTYMGMSHETPLPEIGKLDRAFYFAVNKNNDQLYVERINYDGGVYMNIIEKARRIIFSPHIPPRISEKPDFYQCKWCNFQGVCHGKVQSKDENVPAWDKPQRNCRTCLHSTAYDDGTWRCEKWNRILAPEEQRAGCEKHLYIPSLLPFKQIDATDNSVIYDNEQGGTLTNYEGGHLG